MRRAVLLLLLLLVATIASAQLDEQGVLPLMPPKRWAIVIGAGKYETLGELRYAPADARDFAKLLVEDYKFRPESVTKLIDEPNVKPPTVANIRKQLDETLGDPRLNKGDLFIFYFSGHGVGTAKGDYLCPTDATKDNITEVGLPVKEVIERIVKAGLRNVLVITDACRGGEKNSFGKELAALSDKANIGVMLGCEPGRRSYQNARAGHGYFTDALLEALRKPELRQKDTGALWASEVGKFLAEEVEKDTSKREGIPQVPAIECDDRQDVMVGAFVPANFDEKTLAALKAVKEGLDPGKLSAALSVYANRLWDDRRLSEAAELLRMSDGLTPLEAGDRLLLAVALDMDGRENEAAANFRKVANSGVRLYADLATLLSPESKDIDIKVEAARRVFIENSDAGFVCGLIPLIGAPGDSTKRTELLADFLKGATHLKEQTKTYIEAEAALDKVDLKQAEALFKKALGTFGVQVEPNRIRWRLAQTQISQLKIREAVDTCTDGAAAKQSDEGDWLLLRGLLHRLHLGDRAAAAADARLALRCKLTPDQMLSAMHVLGAEMIDSVEDLRKCAESNPRSVPGQVMGFIVGLMGEKQKLPFSLPAGHLAFRYAEDPKSAVITYEKATASLWQDLMDDGAIPPDAVAAMVDSRASNLLSAVPAGGDDAEFWRMLAERCLQARRAPQALAYFEKVWSKRLAEGKVRPSVLAAYAMVALSAGDWKVVDTICGSSKAQSFEEQDLPWMHAVSLLIRGDRTGALQKAKVLGDPGSGYKDIADALRLLASIQGKDSKSATAALNAAPAPELLVGNVLKALGWLEVGDMEKAGSLLERAAGIDNWAHQAVDAYVLAQFAAALKAGGNIETADQIVFVLQFTFPWMPSLRDVSYGSKNDLASYEGEMKFGATQVADDRSLSATSATFRITATGKVTGKVGDFDLQGTLDGKGNLRGTASGNGKTWDAYAKLAPKSYYESFEQLKNGNQTLILQSREGPRLAFLLKPAG